MGKVDVFFVVKPEHIVEHNKMALIPDDDILPLDILNNAFVIYQDEDKAIIQYRADIKTIRTLAEQSGCQNPLSQEAVDILGFTNSYLGRSLDDVFVRFPELAGTRQVETEEGTMDVDIIQRIEIL